jgi:organic radical activating enzyme
MYCPENRHNNNTKFPDLDRMKSHWQQIFAKTQHLGLKYKLNWSGGEPTVWRDFSALINWLRCEYNQHIQQMGTISNGSASTQYYLKLFSSLDYLSFSTHTEYLDERKFFQTAQKCQEYASHTNKSFMINIMEEYWDLDANKRLIDICKDKNINFHVSRIRYNLPGTRTYPIFKDKTKVAGNEQVNEQLVQEIDDTIKSYLNLPTNFIEEDKNYNAQIYYDNGHRVNIYSAKMYLLNLHHFQGWQCRAGSHRIFVLPDTSVWSAECQNDFLGYLEDSSFQIKTQPVTCQREVCTNNPDDIMTEKYAV